MTVRTPKRRIVREWARQHLTASVAMMSRFRKKLMELAPVGFYSLLNPVALRSYIDDRCTAWLLWVNGDPLGRDRSKRLKGEKENSLTGDGLEID